MYVCKSNFFLRLGSLLFHFINSYSQCENMKLHYEIPILLIEFDEDKSFSIQVITMFITITIIILI